jgi:hypothetical protein
MSLSNRLKEATVQASNSVCKVGSLLISDKLSKEEKTLAIRCAKKIFAAPPPGMKNHQKICYLKADTDYPFQYTIAEIYPDFVIGCKALYSLAEKMKDKIDTINTNPFVKNILKQHNDE